MTGRLPDPPSSWSVTCPACGRVMTGFGGMGATNTLTRHRIVEHTADREIGDRDA